ncbi:MAG: DUF1565 domain-containing protein, partial [Leptolyngbya sp. SIO1D8]|nr:DUF1565 domain-containing protein [Leptolyngbya sp. SIO1D8]
MTSRVCLSMVAILGGSVGWMSQLPGWAATAEPGMEADAAVVVSPAIEGAIAQTPNNQGFVILHVNATAGNDIQGTGSQMQPLKTITYALRIAQPNTLILLAEGVYSADTGETFPMQLRPGVTIQGAAGPNAANVVIQGSASHISPSKGLQNVALLGADNAGLANVTVSNPHPSGVGLWIESSSPIILESAFFRNGSTGIYIANGGSPSIRNSYFSENGEAGLIITGPSSAQVEGNVFENTGTGISVAPEATPQIVDNRIMRNLDGLILHADARPILENNQITQNRRNSVLDYSPWSDTLVTSAPQASQPPPPSIPTVATSPAPANSQPLTEQSSVEPPQETAVIERPPSSETEIAATPSIPEPPTSISTDSLPQTTVESEGVPESSPLPEPEASSTVASSPPPASVEGSPAAPESIPPVSEGIATALPPAEVATLNTPSPISLTPVGRGLSANIEETVPVLAAVELPTTPVVPVTTALSNLDLTPTWQLPEWASTPVNIESTTAT